MHAQTHIDADIHFGSSASSFDSETAFPRLQQHSSLQLNITQRDCISRTFNNIQLTIMITQPRAVAGINPVSNFFASFANASEHA